METLTLNALIAAVVAAIVSLAVPWSKWGVEKRDKRFNERRKFIRKCRDRIEISYFRCKSFSENALYLSLKSHLSPKLIGLIESKIELSSEEKKETKDKLVRVKLLKEIGLLEKKWGLI